MIRILSIIQKDMQNYLRFCMKDMTKKNGISIDKNNEKF